MRDIYDAEIQVLIWTIQQRQERCLEIDDRLGHNQISGEEQWQLLFEQRSIFVAGHNFYDAIASYDKALEIKPNKDEALYKKACNYALSKESKLALEHLQTAIALNPEYREMAKHDSDFASIKDDPRFQALVQP